MLFYCVYDRYMSCQRYSNMVKCSVGNNRVTGWLDLILEEWG